MLDVKTSTQVGIWNHLHITVINITLVLVDEAPSQHMYTLNWTDHEVYIIKRNLAYQQGPTRWVRPVGWCCGIIGDSCFNLPPIGDSFFNLPPIGSIKINSGLKNHVDNFFKIGNQTALQRYCARWVCQCVVESVGESYILSENHLFHWHSKQTVYSFRPQAFRFQTKRVSPGMPYPSSSSPPVYLQSRLISFICESLHPHKGRQSPEPPRFHPGTLIYDTGNWSLFYRHKSIVRLSMGDFVPGDTSC